MDVTSVSNSDLDNAWYASYQANDAIGLQFYGDEIARRLGTWWEILTNAPRFPDFPHYEALTNFVTPNASVIQAVGNIPADIGNIPSSIASGLGTITAPITSAMKWVFGAGAVLLVALVVVKLKK